MKKFNVYVYETYSDKIIIWISNSIFIVMTFVFFFMARLASYYKGYDIIDAKYIGLLMIFALVSFFFPFYSNSSLLINQNNIIVEKKGFLKRSRIQYKKDKISNFEFINLIKNKHSYNSFEQIECKIKGLNNEELYILYFQKFLIKSARNQVADFIDLLEKEKIKHSFK